MRALTVQQPWAWAIVHGGKDVENRTQAWGYRGPLAIHAGARVSERGVEMVPRLIGAQSLLLGADVAREVMAAEAQLQGAIIGVVDLVEIHPAELGATCSAWAESSYAEHGGRTRRDVVHLVLANARPLQEPIPCKGRLGLWTPPADVLEQLLAVAP